MTFWRSVLSASVMLGGLALAGCASTPPPAAPANIPLMTEQDFQGSFKIGNPYTVDGKWYYPAENYAYVEEGIASWYGKDFQGKRTANGERYDMNALTAAHPTLPLPSMVRVTNLDNGRVLNVRVNDRGPFKSNRIIDVSRRAAQLLGFYDVGTAHVRVEIDAQESLNLKNLALKQHPPDMPQVAAAPREAITEDTLAPVVAHPSEIVTPPEPARPAAKAPAKAKARARAPAVARAMPGPEVPALFVQAGAFSEAANAHRLEQQLSSLGAVSIVAATVNNVRLYRVRLGPIATQAAADLLLNRVKAFGYADATVVRE